MLIQAGIAEAFPNVPGGYGVELPKDLLSKATPLAWNYRSITSEASYVLEGQDAFTDWEVQIDCNGFSDQLGGPGMAGAIQLARAIDGVLRGGFSGVLPDPDATLVYGIYRQPGFIDGFSDLNRSYVRSLEYHVGYAQI